MKKTATTKSTTKKAATTTSKAKTTKTTKKTNDTNTTNNNSIGVKSGDIVKFHYRKKLINNVVLEDSFAAGTPFQFTVGENQILPGFEKNIIGMVKGEIKTFQLSCEEAYGEFLVDNFILIKRHELPQGLNIQVGQTLHFPQENGSTLNAEVLKVMPSTVILNTNHPLAGENIEFDVEIVDITSGNNSK